MFLCAMYKNMAYQNVVDICYHGTSYTTSTVVGTSPSSTFPTAFTTAFRHAKETSIMNDL